MVNDHGSWLMVASVFHTKLRLTEYVHGVYRFDGGMYLGKRR
ncbi:hypothetical protein [Nitrosomonas sp.]